MRCEGGGGLAEGPVLHAPSQNMGAPSAGINRTRQTTDAPSMAWGARLPVQTRPI